MDEQADTVVLVKVTHTLLDWALLEEVLQFLSLYYNGVDCPISPIIEEKLEEEVNELGKETSASNDPGHASKSAVSKIVERIC